MRYLNSLACIALTGLVCQAYCQKQPVRIDPEAIKLQKWSEFLTHIVATEDIQLAAPVILERMPPPPFKRAYGAVTLIMLSHIIGAGYSFVDRCVTYERLPSRRGEFRTSGHSWVAQWLQGVGSNELQSALSDDGLSLSSMSLSDRISMLTQLGMPMQMLEGFSVNGNETYLSVRYVIDASFTTKSGQQRFYRFSSRPSKTVAVDQNAGFEFDAIVGHGVSRTVGEFDFEEGQVLQVEDLLKLILERSGKTFVCDPRIKKSYVFLSGKFDRENLTAVLRKVLQIPELEEHADEHHVSESELSSILQIRLERLLAEFTEMTGVDAQWGLQKRNLGGALLSSLNPGFLEFLSVRGINPVGLQVTLSPGILFNISAPGETRTNIYGDGLPTGIFRHNFTFAFRP